MSWSYGQVWRNDGRLYISSKYFHNAVSSIGMWKSARTDPAIRMCCSLGINSQSEEHNVSPDRNRKNWKIKTPGMKIALLSYRVSQFFYLTRQNVSPDRNRNPSFDSKWLLIFNSCASNPFVEASSFRINKTLNFEYTSWINVMTSLPWVNRLWPPGILVLMYVVELLIWTEVPYRDACVGRVCHNWMKKKIQD